MTTPSTPPTPPTRDPAALDRGDPAAEVARSAEAHRNWGRWGEDDRIGTANLITDERRLAAARLVTRGAAFSLAQRFDSEGPQNGWRRMNQGRRKDASPNPPTDGAEYLDAVSWLSPSSMACGRPPLGRVGSGVYPCLGVWRPPSVGPGDGPARFRVIGEAGADVKLFLGLPTQTKPLALLRFRREIAQA